MGNDDKLDADAEVGAKDVAAQVRRFNRVNDILLRAIKRYDQIIADIGSPAADPQVQAALQTIVRSAGGFATAANPVDGIIVKVAKQPGPISDPAVQATTTLIQNIGQQLAGSGGISNPP